MKKELLLNGHNITVLVPEGKIDTLFYVNENDINRYLEAYSRFTEPKFGLVLISDINWFYDLTPWFAPTVYESGPDFGGHASEHLSFIENTVIPQVEKLVGIPEHRGILGYSLGGLFAVYSFYQSDRFDLSGCFSGSMWYDNFYEWMAERKPKATTGSIYFSIGKEEEITEYVRMRTTSIMMRKAVALLNDQEYDAFFEYMHGDHFENIPDKVERGLRWLMGE
jgi:predicted alpha/beta superfamily hydrolase